MGNGWTPERRATQAKAIRRWKPWQDSTGPTTAEGKATSSRNSWKGGLRDELRQLRKVLEQEERRTGILAETALGLVDDA